MMRDIDAVIKALGDPRRRQLLDRLNACNGLTLTQLCTVMGMTRQSVTKHLDVLVAANLITTLRRGRESLDTTAILPCQRCPDKAVHRGSLSPGGHLLGASTCHRGRAGEAGRLGRDTLNADSASSARGWSRGYQVCDLHVLPPDHALRLPA
jgi:DNA-binding transcriptional ArsR family regulator